MREKKNINGIILAGGKATRMNGADKGLLRHNGMPIIEHLMEILQPLTDEILIIANNDAYNYLGLRVFKDVVKEIGPLGGIYTALTHSSARRDIVVACDMPDIPGSFLNFLVQESNGSASDIIIPEYKDKLQPLCAIYSKTILPYLEEFIAKKNYSLKDLIMYCSHKKILIDPENPFSDRNMFSNVNTEKEYKLLSEKQNAT